MIALLQQGDQDGLSKLYDYYGANLYGVVRNVVKDELLAEEVTQDVFIKIWKNWEKYDSKKGRLFTWMINIARRTAIDARRSKRFKQDQKTDVLEVPAFDRAHGGEESRIKDSGLQTVISSMDEKYRTLIRLAYFEGYTQQEIQEELDIPLGTIKSRMRTALKQLRDLLESDNAGVFITITVLLLLSLLFLL